MIRYDMDDVSDEDFDNVVLPCQNKLHEYVQNTFLDEYVAYNISVYYRGNAMWDEPFATQVKSAVEDLAQFSQNDCNYSKIKDILENKYKLKVVCDSPIDIKDLKEN